MIKAVLFDFYETVVTFDPPREELQARACREFGVEVDTQAIPRAYRVADDSLCPRIRTLGEIVNHL
jgi:FMN phosphatase YigB (HAD superfamily)